ncbi:hypothetical protein EW146_g4376 [Bondarzewia mesenterica]|uniref:Uncharacterized protein n=1 Tax=Bondarzewia mesenterica TaxID=1095465 RepID=A0A4S4LVV0_9AGAM|nr:hypothetical protein EW146_g4376 [Bondarzewia mesenterica]
MDIRKSLTLWPIELGGLIEVPNFIYNVIIKSNLAQLLSLSLNVMPGPSNYRKKRRTQAKKDKRSKARASLNAPGSFVEEDSARLARLDERHDSELHVVSRRELDNELHYIALPISEASSDANDQAVSTSSSDTEQSRHRSTSPATPSPTNLHTPPNGSTNTLPATLEKIILCHKPDEDTYDPTYELLQHPMIHDPGNGPRVRQPRAFIASSFAQPPYTEDPLCAEFAKPEVLQMLCTVLPEETALFLWYNKSRKTGRICPACRRLYNLGDALPDPLHDPYEEAEKKEPSPRLLCEQQLSGLCSPLCFILASFNYPGAIRSTWGCMAEDIDDASWALLNTAGGGQLDFGLGMLLKMTRLHDLGLAQLCLPDLQIDEEIYERSFEESVGTGVDAWPQVGEVGAGGEYRSMLPAASSRDHRAIVRLLKKGADVNLRAGEYDTLLQAASSWSDEGLVQLLLEKGADQLRGHRTAAAGKGADVNVQGGQYGTELQAASCCSCEAIVRLLLEHGAYVDVLGGVFGSAPQVALYRGGHFGTVFQAASIHGDKAVVRLLLENGADVNAQGGECGSALQAASTYHGAKTAMMLLPLERAQTLTCREANTVTALQTASYCGDEVIVRLLLENSTEGT